MTSVYQSSSAPMSHPIPFCNTREGSPLNPILLELRLLFPPGLDERSLPMEKGKLAATRLKVLLASIAASGVWINGEGGICICRRSVNEIAAAGSLFLLGLSIVERVAEASLRASMSSWSNRRHAARISTIRSAGHISRARPRSESFF